MTKSARAVVAYRKDTHIIIKFESLQSTARVFKTASNVIRRYCERGNEFPDGFQGPGWFFCFKEDFHERYERDM